MDVIHVTWLASFVSRPILPHIWSSRQITLSHHLPHIPDHTTHASFFISMLSIFCEKGPPGLRDATIDIFCEHPVHTSRYYLLVCTGSPQAGEVISNLGIFCGHWQERAGTGAGGRDGALLTAGGRSSTAALLFGQTHPTSPIFDLLLNSPYSSAMRA